VPRVVFDALAEAQLVEHFQIEAGALLDALAFDQLLVGLEELDALAQLVLDLLDRLQHRGARRDVMAGGEHREAALASAACAR
jgi:hypothetical protein